MTGSANDDRAARMPERHPVAKFLTAEQRARVAATTFVRTFWDGVRAPAGRRSMVCPLSVALGLEESLSASQLCVAFDVEKHSVEHDTIRQFMRLVDRGEIAPENVHALLGCEVQS